MVQTPVDNRMEDFVKGWLSWSMDCVVDGARDGPDLKVGCNWNGRDLKVECKWPEEGCENGLEDGNPWYTYLYTLDQILTVVDIVFIQTW